jgi:hypothetical protein
MLGAVAQGVRGVDGLLGVDVSVADVDAAATAEEEELD